LALFFRPTIILLNLAVKTQIDRPVEAASFTRQRSAISIVRALARHAFAACLALMVFYFSLLLTSTAVSLEDAKSIERAINLLDEKGFSRETFFLRHVATFRSGNNWLNELAEGENSYAATNFPFEIITLYPDFYAKATDDTERAMILLHEAQHLLMGSETTAYAYVWRERQRLGWTQLSHGMTPTFVTVELQTREYAPELFSCSFRLWNDCTENLRASR
jgi:hypothetical protein